MLHVRVHDLVLKIDIELARTSEIERLLVDPAEVGVFVAIFSSLMHHRVAHQRCRGDHASVTDKLLLADMAGIREVAVLGAPSEAIRDLFQVELLHRKRLLIDPFQTSSGAFLNSKFAMKSIISSQLRRRVVIDKRGTVVSNTKKHRERKRYMVFGDAKWGN